MKRRALLQSALALTTTGLTTTPLLARTNTTLEQRIQQVVTQMRREGRVSADERTAWTVTDIQSGARIVSINADRPMQCASMVKHMVIQAYLMCHFTKDSKLYPLSPRVMEEMRGMIVKSNNEFTNHIIKRLGGPQGVQWMLKKEAPHIFRNINIVEYIPENGRTYKNQASAADYDRFLLALWRNELPGSNILKKMMSIPNHDRIRSATKFVSKNATVYDKTGSTSMLCGDTGIIACKDKFGGTVPYTITGIIEKSRRASNYGNWISERSDVMRDVSDQVYLYFAKRYSLPV
ncbi:class A beta-lactamase-related serine hydrolase [Cardiobacteriaceae bacterium TAE3-ERU3]|nr:class A beta-lactamase-related serine hydrolase [Cardiobacteriaceae bacterium TAE3-ERU3]